VDLLKYAVLLAIAEEAREEAVEPLGYMYHISTTVTGLTVIDFVESEPRRPLFSLTVYNDGEADVYVSINSYERKAPLKPGETLRVEFRKPKIRRLYLDVDEGRSAYIRGYGIY
jgi:hypothetical protein